MRKKEPFMPPEIRFMTTLELEGAILSDSKTFGETIEDTGHETETFTTSTYWENN